MTIEELRQKPVGWLDKRVLKIKYKSNSSSKRFKMTEEEYYLGKIEGKRGDTYFIGFLETGFRYSNILTETEMLELINDNHKSNSYAMDVYLSHPELSEWLHESM